MEVRLRILCTPDEIVFLRQSASANKACFSAKFFTIMKKTYPTYAQIRDASPSPPPTDSMVYKFSLLRLAEHESYIKFLGDCTRRKNTREVIKEVLLEVAKSMNGGQDQVPGGMPSDDMPMEHAESNSKSGTVPRPPQPGLKSPEELFCDKQKLFAAIGSELGDILVSGRIVPERLVHDWGHIKLSAYPAELAGHPILKRIEKYQQIVSSGHEKGS